MIKKQDVMKALGELEDRLDDSDVEKASENDLDQPEGSDLGGGHADNKMSDEAPAAEKSKKAKKSLTEDLEDEEVKVKKSEFSEGLPEEIQTKIDVSDFLRSLVDHTGDAIDGLRDSLCKSEDLHNEQFENLTEAVGEIQQSQAKIGVVLKAVCERIGIIEKSPAREPKAETDIVKSEEPVERKFESALGDTDNSKSVFKSLSQNPQIAKAQMATAICDLVKKGDAIDMDVITFESNGHIRPEVYTKLQTILN